MDTEGLSIICAGLGSIEKDDDGNTNYIKEEFCSDNLKDLLRFLRRDDPSTRDVFKQVCKWEIVSKDLIPIIEFCQDDRNLVLNAVKVLVFLTMPLEVMSKDFNEQLEFLWGIKHAITASNVVVVIVSLLEKPLESLECNTFSEDDWKLVQLVLTFFRNILAVQDISAHQKALGSVTLYLSLRDDFLDLLFRENVIDLVIIITQHVSSCRYLRHDNLLLLEIYYHIFMGQDAELVAKVCQEESKAEIEAKPSLESLKSIMQEQKEKRTLTRLHASRHSKFSGTFTRLTLDGSKTMCKGRPSSASCDKLLKPEKVHRGPSKRIVKDYTRLPTTKRSILERLRDFLNQFLTGGYNVLMQSIAQDIEKEHHAIQTSDVIMFFHLAQFVTSFQYHKFQLTKSNEDAKKESSVSDDDDDDSAWFKGELCGPIAATLNDSMFALVIAKWHFAFEGLKEMKNNAFLSVAGSLLKTMIRMLDLVLKIMPEKSREPQTARIILYKLFYDQTDQGLTQFLLNMVRTFDAHKQPKSDLADLVEIIHVITRLMEKLQSHGTLRVARKSRKAKKKKDDMKTEAQKMDGDEAIMVNGNQPPSSEDITPNVDKDRSTQAGSDEKNENANVSSQVNEIEKSGDERPTSGGATIANGDHGESNQIHELLGNGESNDILAPLGDNGESDQIHDPLGDGESNDIPELLGDHGESDQIHDYLGDGESNDIPDPLGDHGESIQVDGNIVGADDCDSSADEQPTRTNEVDFKMTPLLLSLATSTIISNLCWLLKFYKSNSIATNHYILCLLRRISDDLDLAPMLYQLSCLVIFYDILNEQKASPHKEYESLVQFLTSLVRRMMRKMKDHPLLFVDVLFWKSRKECNYINVVGIQHEVSKMRKEVGKWNHTDETGRSQSKESVPKSMADALGDDEYDVFIPNQPHLEKDQDFDDIAGEGVSGHEDSTIKANPLEGKLQGDTKKKRRLVLSDQLEEKIRDLYEKYKDNLNCNQMIAKALDPDGNISPAQVSRKCKKLGLQFPSKRSTYMSHSSKDNDPDKGGELQLDDSLQDTNQADGPSYLGRPMQARKRVRAMDENEEKIRNLYEQFKDHKRCSHMIAKELDPDGAVTAAQVSRKLKKLGLRTSRMRNEAIKKEKNEASTDGEDDSDNLILSLARKRSKNKEDSSYKELDRSSSDDELTLGSILKKSKRVQKEQEGKHADDLTNQVTEGKDTGNQTTQILEERDEKGEDMDIETDARRPNNPPSSSSQEAARFTALSKRDNLQKFDKLSDSENDALDHDNPGSDSENDATPDTSRKPRSLVMNDNADSVQDGQHYSDLEDSGDEEQTPSISLETSIKRRKLRVVMDFDDE